MTPARRLPAARRPESAYQSDLVGYLRAVLPNAVVYANANAARRTASGKASNGVPGLLPGIPDLSVVCQGGRVLYFEVKAPGGKLSQAQERVIARLKEIGAFVAVVPTIDDVQAALATWGIETRLARAPARPRSQAVLAAIDAELSP